MSGEHTFSNDRIREIQEQVDAALQTAIQSGADQKVIDALRSSLEVLSTLAEPIKPAETSRYRGSIDYTFEDDACPPYGRQVEVRVYYGWDDYNPADEPFPIWGARIEEVDVLAVNYYDQNGNVVEIANHHRDLAWSLVAQEREAVTQACTDDGCRNGVGAVHPLYTPSRVRAKLSPATARRMAPSERTREQQREQRKSM